MAVNGIVKTPYHPLSEILLPHLVEDRARTNPDAIYAEYPVSSSSYDDGFRKITYADFANAINGIAWWLHHTLGPGQDFETLAYIGPNDLRYPALVLGAVKAGYVMFLTSPRNSVPAHLNLFHRLNCRTLLSPASRPAAVNAINDAEQMRILEVPEVEYFLGQSSTQYPYEKLFLDAQYDPLFVVHTSGSTGMPKPIIYRNATATANTKMISLEPPDGFESQDKMYQGNRVFITFPPFHGASLVSFLFNAIPFGTTMIAPVSAALPSGNGLVAGLRKTSANIGFIVPSIVQDLSQDPNLLDYCAQHLEAILYCGGDLPQAIGDIVAAKVKLFNQFGATELGLTPNILSLKDRSNADWKYVQFHPKLGLEFKHTAEDVFELYAIRNPELKDYQYTFTLFPDEQEYATRDLFVRHPDKPDLWRWKARADDIIVFLNGEKTNPISMEQHITASNPDVAAALVVGAQRFQAALLIEPSDAHEGLSAFQRADLIERIWPSIEEANREAPSHARILKSHILFTTPQKPMFRAGKGTVQRSGTLKAYESEIEALYRDAERMTLYPSTPGVVEPVCFDDDTVSQCIRNSIMAVTSWPDLSDSENLFTRGMDSLHILLLTGRLKQQLQLRDLSPSTIYTNPSVSTLTKAILDIHNQSQEHSSNTKQTRQKNRDDLLNEYKRKIDELALVPVPPEKKPAEKKTSNPETVVLTGSTGALGSYLLDTLLANPAVAHVHCLNRAPDSHAIQSSRNKARGLKTDLTSKATFHHCSLSTPALGLPTDTYAELLASTTLIIHNAWPVNFNLDLPSFRPQLDGVINLIDLASHSLEHAHLYFISSISSVMGYHPPSTKIPERITLDSSAPAPNGYAESKHISEILLAYAEGKLNTKSSIARVGQLAGPMHNPRSPWNPAEWFPSLVISSAHIGALPTSLGPTFNTITWLPIDLASEIISELALQKPNPAPETETTVHNLVNPHPIPWSTVREQIASTISLYTRKPTEIVSCNEWLGKVRHAMVGSSEEELEAALRRNPAAKLLAFYEAMFLEEEGEGFELEMGGTLARSETLREVEGVRGKWIRGWVGGWLEGGKEG